MCLDLWKRPLHPHRYRNLWWPLPLVPALTMRTPTGNTANAHWATLSGHLTETAHIVKLVSACYWFGSLQIRKGQLNLGKHPFYTVNGSCLVAQMLIARVWPPDGCNIETTATRTGTAAFSSGR